MSSWPRRRRRQRRDENYIWTYQFPERIEERCRHHHPELAPADWKLVEQGLREWFLCCAWRDGEVLGMPSRLVDEAWHEFILDTRAYTDFCEGAFGEYLHHTPEASMGMPMDAALDRTAQAWDRAPNRGAESVLWGLDALLGATHGVGLTDSGGGAHHHHGGGGEGGEAGSSGEGEAGGGDLGGAADSGGGGDSGGGAGDSGGGSDSGGGGGDSGGGGCGGGGCGGGN